MVAFWPHGLPVLIINVTMTLKFKFKKHELELKFFGVYNFLVKREKGSKGERGADARSTDSIPRKGRVIDPPKMSRRLRAGSECFCLSHTGDSLKLKMPLSHPEIWPRRVISLVREKFKEMCEALPWGSCGTYSRLRAKIFANLSSDSSLWRNPTLIGIYFILRHRL